MLKKTIKKTVSIILAILMLLVCVSCKNENNTKTNNNVPTKKNKEQYIKWTDVEYNMLARLVSAESSICSTECQRAVASVVINRLEAGYWGDTLKEVIYYPNAFSPVLDEAKFNNEKPTKSVYAAVDFVIKNGPTIPSYVRYFRANYDFEWKGYKHYKTFDNMHFGYFENWQNGEW